jgi:hypothetical protein
MDEHTSQARLLLARSTETLRKWALARFALLIAQARIRYARQAVHIPVGPRMATQRFGNKLWSRVTTRFPALGDWLAGLDVERAPVTQNWPAHSRVEEQPQQVTRDIEALVRDLRDSNAETAAAAAIALAARAEPSLEPRCQQALLEVLENVDGFFHPLTRVAALQSLALRLSAAPTADELAPLSRAVRDGDAEVSLAAIAAVASRAPAEVAIDTLVPVMLDTSGYFLPLVRDAASRALEHYGWLTKHSA